MDNLSSFSREEDKLWAQLYARQSDLVLHSASKAVKKGIEKLNLHENRVNSICDVSQKLHAISGWTLIPVEGLIPTRDFFFMLLDKQYPVTQTMRDQSELDFAELPDLFHDIFGHVPLLTHTKFYTYLQAFSKIALRHIDNEDAVQYLGRLYWFTFEMGLIREEEELRPYGGAILTSALEISNMLNPNVPKIPYDLKIIMQTSYDNLKLQQQYFVIDSFDQLFNNLELIEPCLASLAKSNANN